MSKGEVLQQMAGAVRPRQNSLSRDPSPPRGQRWSPGLAARGRLHVILRQAALPGRSPGGRQPPSAGAPPGSAPRGPRRSRARPLLRVCAETLLAAGYAAAPGSPRGEGKGARVSQESALMRASVGWVGEAGVQRAVCRAGRAGESERDAARPGAHGHGRDLRLPLRRRDGDPKNATARTKVPLVPRPRPRFVPGGPVLGPPGWQAL